MLLRVVFQEVDRVIGDGGSRVVILTRLYGGKRPAIERVTARREVVVIIQQRVRVIEAAVGWRAIEMPLSGMIRAIPERMQIFREQAAPTRDECEAGDS